MLVEKRSSRKSGNGAAPCRLSLGLAYSCEVCTTTLTQYVACLILASYHFQRGTGRGSQIRPDLWTWGPGVPLILTRLILRGTWRGRPIWFLTWTNLCTVDLENSETTRNCPAIHKAVLASLCGFWVCLGRGGLIDNPNLTQHSLPARSWSSMWGGKLNA